MNYIKYLDETSGISFEVLEVDVEGYDSVDEYFAENPGFMYAGLLSGLHNAIMMNLNCVPVIIIKGMNNALLITEDQYLEKIELCLIYFEKLEEYEFCNYLADLKEILKKNESN